MPKVISHCEVGYTRWSVNVSPFVPSLLVRGRCAAGVRGQKANRIARAERDAARDAEDRAANAAVQVRDLFRHCAVREPVLIHRLCIY